MSHPLSNSFKVDLSDQVAVTVKTTSSSQPRPDAPALLLAHGANNDLENPLLAYLAARLVEMTDVLVVRFNFPYVERGAKSPDSQAVLEDAFRRVNNHVRDELCGPGTPIFVGGKSLGGRVAAELISMGQGRGLVASGLIVLGYPLHAPGHKDRPRLDPLRSIAVPSLFCVGSRDPLCDPELLRPILLELSYPGEMFVLQGGDHSLALSSASRRRPEDGYDDVARKMAAFVEGALGTS
jgi:predicted alpha/beta-hydrolase family hydrolase